MSSRHIRRAKEQLGVSAAKAEAGEEQEEESEEEEEEKIGSAKPFNPFDLLSDGDDDDGVCCAMAMAPCALPIIVSHLCGSGVSGSNEELSNKRALISRHVK